ncbi:cytochrome P450 [Abortiporus biennis]|nr:cytochrome P450 [Abortiporus biennis]
MSLAILTLSLFAVLALWKWYSKSRRSNIPLPPGPPGDPLIGNLRMMPRTYQPEAFYEWSKKYGDVMYLNVLGEHMIVLNSNKAAVDLLEKRSGNYSDRPPFPMHDLIGWSHFLAFLPYGDRFQRQRKLFQQPLTKKGVLVYQNMQTEATHILLNNLLQTPAAFDEHVRRWATSVIMEIAYGRRITSDDDPYIKIAEDINDAITAAGDPGAAPPDLFPILKKLPAWFPGAWWSKLSKDSEPLIYNMTEVPFQDVKKNLEAGTATTSFLSLHMEELLREGNKNPQDWYDIKIAAAHIYGAGGDTTFSTLVTFIYAMLLFPDAQQKAKEELDRVIGSTRLPDFSDRESLPTFERVLRESYRWHQAAPLGIPHKAQADDVYCGMFIPKGAVIISNIRGITLDENVYTDPHKFDPDRYLPQPEGNGEPFISSQFGYGRRVCPGQYLADNSLWIAAASILTVFDIVPVQDEKGHDIIPEVHFTNGLTSHPKPFPCSLRPRSEKAAALIRHAYQDAIQA